MLIYLIGMPASGKSTFGKLIAQKLEYHFLDLDILIEENNKTTIPKLFENKGKEFFRKEEKKALQTTFNLTQTIISTGGGTPCFFDNLEAMKKNGVVCFLNTDLNTLAQRTHNSQQKQQDNRPLFKEATSLETLHKMIEEKWEQRKKCYQKAHFEIKDNNLDEFLERINNYNRNLL